MGLNYNFASKANDDVKTEIDESLSKTRVYRTPEEIERLKKEYFGEKRELIGKNKQEKLGLESSLQKDERIIKLKEGIAKGKVVTVASAQQYMGLSRNTILSYCKEGKLVILDEQKGKWLNAES